MRRAHRRGALLALLLAAAPARALPDCPQPSDTAQLQVALSDAEAAFGQSAAVFAPAMLQVAALLPCLADPLPSQQAAQLHRIVGLSSAVAGDTDRAQAAFAAARAIQPDYRLPALLAPQDGPVAQAYQAAPAESGALEPLPDVAAGQLRVDGRVAAQRSLQRPAAIQRLDGQGAVACTAYLWPAEALPSCLLPKPPAAVPLALEPPEAARASLTRRSGVSGPWLVGAGLAAAAAGTCLALSLVSADAFWDPATPHDQLDALRTRTNGLAAGAAGAGALALGSGLGAFFQLELPPRPERGSVGYVRLLPTGDAHQVWLEGDGARHALGAVPAGRYTVMARFGGLEPVAAGEILLRAGQRVELRCVSALSLCHPE